MNYRIRFHPLVARDLDAIAQWILDYAAPEIAARKLAEIEAAIATLKATPHKGSLRDEIALGLRAIPAGRCRLLDLWVAGSCDQWKFRLGNSFFACSRGWRAVDLMLLATSISRVNHDAPICITLETFHESDILKCIKIRL